MGRLASIHRESAEEVQMEAAKPVASTRLAQVTESDQSVKQQQYQSVVGRVLYLAMELDQTSQVFSKANPAT